MKLFVILAVALAVLSGCGTSKTLVQERYRSLPSKLLCQRLVDGEIASWKEPWAYEVVKGRGDNCDSTVRTPKVSGGSSGGTTKVIVKDCSKMRYGKGFWGNFARGAAGC